MDSCGAGPSNQVPQYHCEARGTWSYLACKSDPGLLVLCVEGSLACPPETSPLPDRDPWVVPRDISPVVGVLEAAVIKSTKKLPRVISRDPV